MRLLVPFIVVGFAVYAQAPSPAIRFEVASIRPVPPGPDLDNPAFVAYRAGKATSFCNVCISGTHYDSYHAWLKVLIADAFRVDSRLVVAPDWVNQTEGTGFTIHAVMPEGATREQIPDMIQALLEERFHLMAHLAPAEQTGYALVVAKNGPKLKRPREMDRSACEPWVAGIPVPNQTCRITREEGDRSVTVSMVTNTAFGPMIATTARGETTEIHDEYLNITIPQLVMRLQDVLSTGSPGMPQGGSLIQVADKTGIEGAWDVVVDRSYGDLALPTLSASLEKLGLRLERTMVPVEKVIVDSVDKMPTEN